MEPDYGELRLELLSESSEMLDRIVGELEDIVAESSTRNGIKTRLDCFFRSKREGIP